MSTQFTEQQTEQYYDEEDAQYRAFWDSEGSLHWGYFDDVSGGDFLRASARLNDLMLERSGIGADANVLDLGCGNGNTSIWLAEQRGCRVTGIDLSRVRVESAAATAAGLAPDVQSRLDFRKASAMELPFGDGQFSHVWSQATIYHVPDKERVLNEVFRVLEPGGTFVFDDLTKPKPKVSAQAQRYVYDRLLFDTPFSFEGYQAGLRDHGFEVMQSEDLSPHLARSYVELGNLAQAATDRGHGDFSEFIDAYRYMVAAVEDSELGWATFVCRK